MRQEALVATVVAICNYDTLRRNFVEFGRNRGVHRCWCFSFCKKETLLVTIHHCCVLLCYARSSRNSSSQLMDYDFVCWEVWYECRRSFAGCWLESLVASSHQFYFLKHFLLCKIEFYTFLNWDIKNIWFYSIVTKAQNRYSWSTNYLRTQKILVLVG